MKWINLTTIVIGMIASPVLSLILRPLFEGFAYLPLLGIAIAALSLLIQNSKGRLLKTEIKTTRLLVPEIKRKKQREGLIVFLPLYRQFSKTSSTVETIEKAVKDLDYSTLRLEDTTATSFGHTTLAIQTHLEKLRCCWLVTTKSMTKEDHSSQEFLPVYMKFLQEEVLQGREVRFPEVDPIDIDDEAQVCEQVSERVQEIFRDARRTYKLKTEQMIVDVTPGSKSMTVGAALGALAKDRDIQIIVSEYEPKSEKPVRSIPILVQYEAKLMF